MVSTAITSDVREAWQTPLKFVSRVGSGAPQTAFYFSKLMIFQCGTSPLWLLRAWPFLSRGFKTWTVQPPELPAMLYGWAYPKVMRVPRRVPSHGVARTRGAQTEQKRRDEKRLRLRLGGILSPPSRART